MACVVKNIKLGYVLLEVDKTREETTLYLLTGSETYTPPFRVLSPRVDYFELESTQE